MLRSVIARAPRNMVARANPFGKTGLSSTSVLAGANRFNTSNNNNSILANYSQQRNAGVSVLGCAIAMVAVGGCAQGMGSLFAALVVGTARNPSIKNDLLAYTFMGASFIELFAIVVIGVGFMLLYSE